MGLDMYMERFPRIGGWTAKHYDQVTDVVFNSGIERREEGGVTAAYCTGLKKAIDFASQLDFVKTEDNKILNEAIREVPIANTTIFRFGEQVGYWRKANSIHKWFVENVQNGVDDCEYYFVSMGELVKLRHVVMQVLDDRSLAMKLLPPQYGFFFGPTDIDEWYWSELETTFKIISEVLESTNWDTQLVTYRASW